MKHKKGWGKEILEDKCINYVYSLFLAKGWDEQVRVDPRVVSPRLKDIDEMFDWFKGKQSKSFMNTKYPTLASKKRGNKI